MPYDGLMMSLIKIRVNFGTYDFAKCAIIVSGTTWSYILKKKKTFNSPFKGNLRLCLA